MAPQDDLTAERAAFQLIWHISQELGLLKSFTVEDFEREDVYPLCRQHIMRTLKTARQEALMEAITIIRQAETWTPQSVLAILECLARDTKLDRLASEGG